MGQELEGKSIGNKNIKVADVIPRPFDKKTNPTMPLARNTQETEECVLAGDGTVVPVSSNGTEDGDTNEGNSTLNGLGSSGRSARDVVTPLAHMPYADQLEHKRNSIVQILKKLVSVASSYLAYIITFLLSYFMSFAFFFIFTEQSFIN